MLLWFILSGAIAILLTVALIFNKQTLSILSGFLSGSAYTYAASIRENIVVSNSHCAASDEELTELTKRTNAWKIIESQPEGLDEIVGTFSQSGNNLSGGEWQRIALTRCVYRDDARIMILDEPTAALDTHLPKLSFTAVSPT